MVSRFKCGISVICKFHISWTLQLINFSQMNYGLRKDHFSEYYWLHVCRLHDLEGRGMVQGFLFWVLGPWSHMMGVAKLEYHALLCEIIPSLL